jgi:hypothetical protein
LKDSARGFLGRKVCAKAPAAMSVCETGRSANHSSYHSVPLCGVKAIARPDVRLRAAQHIDGGLVRR